MALFTAKYRYDDPTLTAPTPGAALINDVGLVVSVPGIGPKTGGRHAGIPLAIGPVHTRIFRPHDRIEMTLPNTQLLLWTAPFETAAFRAGYQGALAKREGWHWLNWTIAEHIAHDLEVETTERAGSADITPVVADGSPLVVVPCGAVKSAVASPAGEMYRSGYHRLGLKAARALTSPESIRILSALHGLLALDRMVEPYDLRMGSPGSITAELRQSIKGSSIIATSSSSVAAATPVSRNPFGRMPAPLWLELEVSETSNIALPASPNAVRRHSPNPTMTPGVTMTVTEIPEAFAKAFIAYANDSNGDADDLDLSVSEDRRELYLSNDHPGFCPYLQLSSDGGDSATAEIRSAVSVRRTDGGFDRTEHLDAQVIVPLSDLEEAPRLAVECWITTL